MSIARHSHEAESGSGAIAGRTGRGRAADRKRGALRTAVTATVTGLALTVPLGSTSFAALTPTALSPTSLRRLHLDAATLHKVRAYDKYRTREAAQRKRAKKALRFARKQIGKPYRWGATGPSGYDCSGLMMAAWRRAGVRIPRVTYAQYRKVDRKVKMRHLKPGDLIFFHGRSHVGMYVGHGRFLHAPNSGARVRIDKFGARRKKQFAGAVRPGAPAYREWSPSVRELVEKIDRMSAQKRADQPPDSERTPHIPPHHLKSHKKSDKPSKKAPRHPVAKAAPPGGHSRPDDSAAQAPRSDTPSDMSKPEPRPRAAGQPRSFWHGPAYEPWAVYVGP
ncbi:NlpC/P60 family protein [Actinomadura sp. NPDC000600]|uniref:C40 family peptidase n=1 Tax=Actinomadura sp. NPDC000600 TaxID=3154262 RepID=UPI0033993080